MKLSFTSNSSFVTLVLLMSSLLYTFSLSDARKLTVEGSNLSLFSSTKPETEDENIMEKISGVEPGGLSVISVEENGHSHSHISLGESYISIRKTLENVHVNDHSPGIGHDTPAIP
ncbi:hypothetical protein SUGI_0698220 [Cryptomeria japonica]|nr:hypothetical protein SUGI_0698220 [Cryptomeria japonica]